MTRTATIRTTVERPEIIAAAVRPDNTAEMRTTVEDGTVVTEIERATTAGLRSTVDDYVVNLSVAVEVARTTTNNGHTDT
jgi:tRNA threonylcarbamoyladenosine modification (KEOPS) complex  Pcc1 subunit